MIKKIAVILLLVNMTSSFAQLSNDINEIDLQDSDLTVMLDNQIRSLCHQVATLQQGAGIDSPDEHLKTLLDQKVTEFDYEIVLKGLHACLSNAWEPQSEKDRALLASLEKSYNELCQEYDQLKKQLSTRRIKCKCFTKVTTRELVACNALIKNNFTTNNLFVGGCLRVNGFGADQAVITDSNGCLTSIDQIPNRLLAPNSVTGGPGGIIANNTITPSNLAFNTVQTSAAEPNPLRIVRGSVTGATGAIVSGAGFTATRTGTGTYLIQFLTPYTNATSYMILAQPTTGYGNLGSQLFINISSQAANQFNLETFDNAGAAADEDFVFFVIGA